MTTLEPTAKKQRVDDAAVTENNMDSDCMKKWAELSLPGEPHELLARFAGAWDYQATWWMSGEGEGNASNGTAVYHTLMGGRFVQGHYQGAPQKDCPMPPMEGLDIIGFDNLRKEFQSTWIDNMATHQMHTTGTYDAKSNQMVMTGTQDDFVTGKKNQPIRTVTTLVDNNNHTYEMFTLDKHGKEFRALLVKSSRRIFPTCVSEIPIVSLLTTDIDKTKDWYCEKLGFSVDSDTQFGEGEDHRWCTIVPGGNFKANKLTLLHANSDAQKAAVGKQAADGMLFVLETLDVHSDFKTMKEKGVEFVSEKPEERPYGTEAVFKDLHGNLIVLIQTKPH